MMQIKDITTPEKDRKDLKQNKISKKRLPKYAGVKETMK